jgi:ribosomal protein S18 acetylase RimI-like enzyme
VRARQTPIRLARADDAAWIAELHCDSWRRNYRGSYSDSYLDGDLLGDRLGVWKARLDGPVAGSFTLIAEQDDRRAGFSHVRLDDDPFWGALLDNLHVCHDLKRAGIGTLLMLETGAWVSKLRPGSGIYLWVQEQNESARSFYRACGGTVHGREPVSPPGGDMSNLNGSPMKLRIAWSSPSLVARRETPVGGP